MNELNDVIEDIFKDKIQKIRGVIVKNLIRDLVDLVVTGIANQSTTEELKVIAGKIDQTKLYSYCLNTLSPTKEEEQEKLAKREKAKNIHEAVDIVIEALDTLIADGDLRVEGVIDKNKLFDKSFEKGML